jgi:hypothetical protein
MADIKGTHSQNAPTRQDFPEVKDKIVDTVELSADSDYYGITIRFHDKTSLTFTVEPCVITFPVLADWAGDDEKLLKEYKPTQSKIPRVS